MTKNTENVTKSKKTLRKKVLMVYYKKDIQMVTGAQVGGGGSVAGDMYTINDKKEKFMIKKKSNYRALNDIGKVTYNFELDLETSIYRYICYKHVKKREKKRIEEYKFYLYSEWRDYIHQKYENYDLKKLIEFSRYLNLRTRNIKPWNDYWTIITSICLTLFFSEIYKVLIDIFINKSDTNIVSYVIMCFVIGIILYAGMIIVIWQTITPILNDSTKENMLIDYKEIIDDMIKEKEFVNKVI